MFSILFNSKILFFFYSRDRDYQYLCLDNKCLQSMLFKLNYYNFIYTKQVIQLILITLVGNDVVFVWEQNWSTWRKSTCSTTFFVSTYCCAKFYKTTSTPVIIDINSNWGNNKLKNLMK